MPEICDFTNNFVLDPTTGTCVKEENIGCDVSAFPGSPNSCYLCEEYKLKLAGSDSCTDASSENGIENCLRFSSESQTCLQCESGHKLENNACVNVGSLKVENCISYTSEGKCAGCADGFILHDNICRELATVVNCHVHTQMQCLRCNSGYVLGDPPEVLRDLNADLFTELIYEQYNYPVLFSAHLTQSMCRKINIANCKVLKTEDSCEECEVNFTLNSRNHCEENLNEQIKNCKEYLNETECSLCSAYFYLENSSKCSPVSPVTNCAKYDPNYDRCLECIEGFWMDSTLNVCNKREIKEVANCSSLAINADMCDKCLTKFVKTNDGKSCVSYILNCQDYLIKADEVTGEYSMVCTSCIQGYKLINSQCEIFNIPNCQVLDLSNFTCTTCDASYYLNESQSTCSQNQVEGCLHYDSTNGECELCGNLKRPSKEKSACIQIQNHPNCVNSNGIDDNCSVCIGEYYVLKSACELRSVASKFDSLCVENNAIVDDSSCSKCAENNFMISEIIPSYSVSEMAEMNCYKAGNQKQLCAQCQDYFQILLGKCAESELKSLKCVKLLPDTSNESLTSGLNCEKCNTELGLYKDSSSSCLFRESVSNYFYCEIPTESANKSCQACKQGTYKINSSQPFCATKQDIMNYTSKEKSVIQTKYIDIPNCQIRKNSLQCLTCKRGFILTASSEQCLSPLTKIAATTEVETIKPPIISLTKNVFNITLDPITAIHSDNSFIDNCAEYSQINETKLGCIKCNNNFVGIIKNTRKSKADFEVVSSVNSFKPGSSNWNPFRECEPAANIMFHKLDKKHIDHGDCELGIKVEDHSGYICIRCVKGQIGILVDVTSDMDNKELDEKIVGIGFCDPITDNIFHQDHTGMGYEVRFNKLYPQWGNYMPFSGCVDDSKILLYYLETSFDVPELHLTNVLHHNGIGLTQAYCLNPKHFPSNEIVDNCQIYGVKYKELSLNSTAVGRSYFITCLACRPGYASERDDNWIVVCNRLSNCKENSTWMGGCSDPIFSGWEGGLDGESFVTFYERPVAQFDVIQDCRVVYVDTVSEASTCKICYSGFAVGTDGKCRKINLDNKFCQDLDLGTTAIETTKGVNANKQIMGSYYIRAILDSSELLNANIICTVCEDGKELIQLPENALNICGTSLDYVVNDQNQKCKFSSLDLNVACYECHQNYVYDLSSKMCVDKDKFDNCLWKENFVVSEDASTEIIITTEKCVKCEDNYIIDSNGLCVLQNCKEFNYIDLKLESANKQCMVCEDNMIPKKVEDSSNLLLKNDVYCYPNPKEDDECLNYSPELDHCVKCKDSTKIPYLIFKSKKLISKCVNFSSDSSRLSEYNTDYLFITYGRTASSNMSYLERVDTKSQVLRTKSGVDLDNVKDCLKNNPIPNCEEGFLMGGLYCLKCQQNHYLDEDTNTCALSSIRNCQEVELNKNLCSKCEDKYFVNTEQTCTLRIVNVNCKIGVKDADQCENCVEGLQWLNTTTMSCDDYSSKFCEKFVLLRDSCEKCQNGHWRKQEDNGHFSCQEYSVNNCWSLDPYKDNCLMCRKGFLRQSSNCVEGTMPNCELIDRNESKCLVCSEGHYMKTENEIASCQKNDQVEKCKTYKNYVNECKTCIKGYYLLQTSNECKADPGGIENCKSHSNSTTCIVCDTNYYLENNICEEVTSTISNCLEYSSNLNCTKCFPHLLLINNQCKEITAWNCSEYIDEHRCKSCIPNYILNIPNATCIFSGIFSCVELETAAPATCKKCIPGYIPNELKKACVVPPKKIPNCYEYLPSGKCSTCELNYYLDMEKANCILLNDNQAGEFCVLGEMIEPLRCDLCKLGNYLVKTGLCHAMPSENCLVFDWDSKICSMCAPNSYMDQFGFCQKIF